MCIDGASFSFVVVFRIRYAMIFLRTERARDLCSSFRFHFGFLISFPDVCAASVVCLLDCSDELPDSGWHASRRCAADECFPFRTENLYRLNGWLKKFKNGERDSQSTVYVPRAVVEDELKAPIQLRFQKYAVEAKYFRPELAKCGLLRVRCRLIFICSCSQTSKTRPGSSFPPGAVP